MRVRRSHEMTLAEQTAYILDEIVRLADTYITFPTPEHRDAVCLWAAHAHVYKAFETTPRLSVRSADPGSGKTMVLTFVEQLVPNPVNAVGVTPGVLWRLFDHRHPTLIMDEVDTIFGRNGSGSAHIQLRGVINAGHRKGATVPRCVGSSDVKEFNVFGPIAMAGLGRVPETVASRSIEVPMRKRKAGDPKTQPFRLKYAGDRFDSVRALLEAWSEVAMPGLVTSAPDLPVADRRADVWEPLVAIADMAGEQWAERARRACTALTTEAAAKPTSLGLQLLSDLRTVMGDRENMWTAEIITGLLTLPDSLWTAGSLDARKLARVLAEYGVAPTTLRRGTRTFKGYRADQLADIWAAMLPERAELASAE